MVFRHVEQTPKPTRTLPYLTASSLICNTLRNRRERVKLYPCLSFLNQVLTLHPAKCLENYSYCRRNIISFSQRVRVAEDNRWDFIREINSCSLPAHSSRKLPPLWGIKGNHPHRNVEVVRLQRQGKNTEICTWFNCHHGVVKIHDCIMYYFCGKILCFSRHTASLAGGWSHSNYCAASRTRSGTGRAGTWLQTSPGRASGCLCQACALTSRQRCLGGA